ncbi:unannotated protein [freshwater metagenome]|uniref:Unannotated protein n=1 Tax=freshwater metagenome TaxID=449393 RepID=A0A6J7IQ47_9ZZZZ|nr:hypothetical protein [Actinomycetota bacterium]
MAEPEKTPDGHYVIIDGRKWRATDPRLSEEERQEHVDELMSARRAVGAGRRAGDDDAVAAARARVHAAKVALGERGPKWWEDDDAPAPPHTSGGDAQDAPSA